MSNSFFDLDISFEDDPAPDLSKIPVAKLRAAIEELPEALKPRTIAIATGGEKLIEGKSKKAA